MMKQTWAGVILSCCTALATVVAQTPAPPPPGTNPPLPPLEQLLAPVALYPDALLAQVLTSATSPGQVTEMNTWLQQNKDTLHGTELQDAAQARGYDASFVALALFPDVMNQLASQIEWTTELGTAFLSDPKGVMNAVQRLRAQAQAAGNLKSTPQQSVVTENQGGQQVIVIQPANPQVVYVPVYNPQVVYYPPPPGAAILIGFGLGIALGAAMSNNYYYGPYGWGAWGMGWHTHTVVLRGGFWVVPPHARYPYVRPIPVPYGGYYRPRPYAYSSTTVNINRVTVNNPGYAGGATPRPKPYTPVARPAPPASTLPATRPGGGAPGAGTPGQRPSTQPGRPAAPNAGGRPAPQPNNPAQRPAPAGPGKVDYGSRGYNAPGNIKPNERASTNSSAFTGYQNGGAERAASQRGQGSVSRGQTRNSGKPR
jgi:hypothetical protein